MYVTGAGAEISKSSNMDSVTQRHIHHSNHSRNINQSHSNHKHHDNVKVAANDHNMGHNDHQMYMYFHTTAFEFLVQSWGSASIQGMVASLVMTVGLAVLLEAVKGYLYYHELRARRVCTSSRSKRVYQMVLRTCHTCLYALRVVIGYLVMLAVMSYNAWLVTGAIVGSAIGYFIVQPFLNFYLRRIFHQKHVTAKAEENGRLVECPDEEVATKRRSVTVWRGSRPESIDVITSFIEQKDYSDMNNIILVPIVDKSDL